MSKLNCEIRFFEIIFQVDQNITFILTTTNTFFYQKHLLLFLDKINITEIL